MRGQGTPGNELLFPGTSASPVPGIGGPYGMAFLTDPSLPAGHCNSKTNHSSCFAQDSNGNWIIPANRVNQNALVLLNALVPLPNNLTGGVYSATSSATDYLNVNPNITKQWDVLGKIDHDINSHLRLMGEYMREEQTFSGANAARFGAPWTTNYDTFITDDQWTDKTLQSDSSFRNPDESHAAGRVPGWFSPLQNSGARTGAGE